MRRRRTHEARGGTQSRRERRYQMEATSTTVERRARADRDEATQWRARRRTARVRRMRVPRAVCAASGADVRTLAL